MFCLNCGIEIPEGSKFCLNCGTPLTVSEPAVEIPEPLAAPEYINYSKNKDEELLRELTLAVEESGNRDEDEDEDDEDSQYLNTEPETAEFSNSANATQKTAEVPKYDNAIYANFATQITRAPVSQKSTAEEEDFRLPKRERKFLSVVLSVFLCIFSLITPAFFSVYDYLNNDVPVAIENTNIVKLADDADLDIVDEIRYNIPKQYMSYYDVKSSDIEKILEDVKLREVVNIYKGYIEAFKSGDEKYQIEAHNIIEIVEDNERLIEKKYDYTFSESGYLRLQNRIEDNYYWENTSVHNILKEADIAVWIPKVILVSYPYIISFILLLVCLVMILLFNIRRLKCLLLVSIPFLISGLFYTILSFIISGLYSGRYSELYTFYISPFKSNLRVCGFALLFLGIISLAIYIIAKKLIAKRNF
jgi:hypothetical protein